MADGGAEPWNEDKHPEDPPAPQPPTASPGHGRTPQRTEDTSARKRPRLCPGTPPESPRVPGGARAGWGPRAGRVTGLYARLLRELEAEVAELQRALAARDEAVLHRDRRIRQLELENRQLRSHVRSLEEENDLLSSGDGQGAAVTTAAAAATAPTAATRTLLTSGSGCLGVSDSNIQFLKGLLGLLESDSTAQVGGLQPFSAASPGEQGCAPADVPRSPLAWQLRAGLPGGFPPSLGTEERAGSPTLLTTSSCLWEESVGDTLPDGTPLWASPVEENGRPKLELVPNSGVYITHPQLDDLSQVSTEKPKLMTRRLLGYFFSRETLARSSAAGQRTAHNNPSMERPLRLPVPVVTAIKEYVTKMCGRGCNFNAVINSKCGTSRRAVRKRRVKME
ncbi:uncharacterized protein LOC128898940 [Dryobates pubescens]|uniref:uncharacterized protein LOC128898940 n=1 Tax=Dryobates pubescens TaxID=118200 RepID=UPI0023B8D31D|nr:uncharacterized protein LOC128898940 [Dryobates pubescens]